MASTPHDGDLGTLLAVFAHPDDEAYLAGGLMAVAAGAGRRVVCVTATKGEFGFPDDDPRSIDERAALREAELAACLDVLGVTEHHWLGYLDGTCAQLDDAGPVGRLREIVEDVAPDTVLTFGPDGQTFHPDHMTVSRWTTKAVRAAAPSAELFFAAMTHEWVADLAAHVDMRDIMMVEGAEPQTVAREDLDLWFVCDDPVLDRKVRALRCQASQTDGFVGAVGEEVYARMNRDEMFCRPAPGDWAS